MHSELEHRISHIEKLTDLHLQLSQEMLLADNGAIFGVDMLATAVINRSMSLCAAFSMLVRAHNYTTACALVRLQLDSCMRFFAAFLVENPHDFSLQVIKGVPIKKLKDASGQKMTDRYLVEKLGVKYEWMPRVYGATSGFIQLSERHIFTTWELSPDRNSAELCIGSQNDDIEDSLWIEMVDGFLACTDALFEHIKGWIFTKKNPELVRQIAIQRVVKNAP